MTDERSEPAKRTAATRPASVAAVAAPSADHAHGAPIADLASRLGAACIDVALVALVGLAALVVGGILGNEGGLSRVAWIFLPALGVLGVQVYQWHQLATTGQTIGKRYYRIRVVTRDGAAAGFGAAVVMRAWLPTALTAIPYAGWLFGVVDVLFVFGARRRCLHDRMAGTTVVACADRD
jgi:uncharacterized RDD family membrane protein YckC